MRKRNAAILDTLPSIKNQKVCHPINKRIKACAIELIEYISNEEFVPYPLSVYRALPKVHKRRAFYLLKIHYPKLLLQSRYPKLFKIWNW